MRNGLDIRIFVSFGILLALCAALLGSAYGGEPYPVKDINTYGTEQFGPLTNVNTHVLIAAVICGFIGLDRTALGQFMISQPVVAGPLTGWLLGDATAGFIIGGMLELIWVLDMPIGTFVPADSTVAAVAATAIAVLGSGKPADLPVIGFSLLMTVAMVPVTMFADHLMRQRNARIPELVLGTSGHPTERRLTVWHLAGLIAFFLKSFTLCLGLVPAGLIALAWFERAPERRCRGGRLRQSAR